MTGDSNTSRFASVLAVLFAAATLVGCAGGPAYRPATNDLSQSELQEIAPLVKQYSNQSPPELSSVSDHELALQVIDALPEAERARFRHDPMLDLIAYEQAYAGVRAGELSPDGVLIFSVWKYGRIGQWRWANYSAAGGNAGSALDDALKATLERLLSTMKNDDYAYYTYGVARTGYQFSGATQGLIVLGHRAEFTPFDKAQTPGDSFVISGEVLSPARSCTLYFEKSPGDIQREAVALDADRRFTVTVETPLEAGRHGIAMECLMAEDEAEATNDTWMRSVLEVPIYVDVAEPARPAPELLDPPSDPKYLREWPLAILNGLNAERQRMGLEPFVLDGEASRLALMHAKAIESGESAGMLGGVKETLRKRGLLVEEVYQFSRSMANIAEQLHLDFNSPAFRYYFLKPGVHRIGLGLTRDTIESGSFRMVLYLLEMPR